MLCLALEFLSLILNWKGQLGNDIPSVCVHGSSWELGVRSPLLSRCGVSLDFAVSGRQWEWALLRRGNKRQERALHTETERVLIAALYASF